MTSRATVPATVATGLLAILVAAGCAIGPDFALTQGGVETY